MNNRPMTTGFANPTTTVAKRIVLYVTYGATCSLGTFYDDHWLPKYMEDTAPYRSYGRFHKKGATQNI